MSTEGKIFNANRITSLTYLIAGCLGFSIDNLNEYLLKSNLKLSGEDKRLFNRISSQISQLKTNLDTLERLAFGVMDEEGGLAYEDATHIYWALFLLIIDKAGTDNLYDLRSKALFDVIDKYKSRLNIPGMRLAYHTAFAQVNKAISEGKYNKEDFEKLLEYECRDKQVEG